MNVLWFIPVYFELLTMSDLCIWDLLCEILIFCLNDLQVVLIIFTECSPSVIFLVLYAAFSWAVCSVSLICYSNDMEKGWWIIYTAVDVKALKLVSTGAICSPGDIWQCPKTYSLSQLWEIEVLMAWWAESRKATEHHTVYLQCPPNKESSGKRC